MREWLRGKLIRFANIIYRPSALEVSGLSETEKALIALRRTQANLSRAQDDAARRESRGWN